MPPNLKNYSTTIPAERSIGEIQAILVQFGAQCIMTDIAGKRVIGLSFVFELNGTPISFRLPARVDAVAEYLYQGYRTQRTGRERTVKSVADFQDEAYRITWRILKDWIHAQVSLLQTETIRPEQVFLPYAVDQNGQTLADRFIEGGLTRLLTAGVSV